MANVVSKGTLFPEALTNQMFSLVRGKSSLARLSGAEPIPFNGERVFTFNFDKEADLGGGGTGIDDQQSEFFRVIHFRFFSSSGIVIKKTDSLISTQRTGSL